MKRKIKLNKYASSPSADKAKSANLNNLHAEYAAFWYIRTYFELLNKSVLFPDGVKLLCSSFIGMILNDEWEKKSDHTKGITIFGDDNRWIKRHCKVYKYTTSICGKMVVDCSYIWRLQIGKTNESQFGSLIGIIPNHKVVQDNGDFIALNSRFDIAPYNGYSFWSYNYGETGQVQRDTFKKPYGTKLVTDDIIEIHLNMKQFTVSFIINGKNYGVAFENIENTQYRLIVVIYNDDYVKLLDEI